MYIEVIGIFAVVTTALRLLPQIIKTYKTKKVRDVSLAWEIVGITSSAFWLWYGYLRADQILISGALVVAVSYLILIYQKYAYQ